MDFGKDMLEVGCLIGMSEVGLRSSFWSIQGSSNNTPDTAPPETFPFGDLDAMATSPKDYFFDMPWGNIPRHRQSEFEPPLFRGGLLGGSSDGTPKMSKLQALAAARKKKAQEQKSSGEAGVEKPMAELSIASNATTAKSGQEGTPSKPAARSFPLRKRKDSNPHEKIQKPPTPEEEVKVVEEEPAIELDDAPPSAFASTMFGRSDSPRKRKPPPVFSMPYNVASTVVNLDPFAGPSPDDVVMAAQSQSKGVNTSAKSGTTKKRD